MELERLGFLGPPAAAPAPGASDAPLALRILEAEVLRATGRPRPALDALYAARDALRAARGGGASALAAEAEAAAAAAGGDGFEDSPGLGAGAEGVEGGGQEAAALPSAVELAVSAHTAAALRGAGRARARG